MTIAIPYAPSRRELVADGVVHALGLVLGLPAAIALVLATALDDGPGQGPARLAPVAIYAACLIAMLGCSAAYNLLRASRLRLWLRRFDHAAIFAMIGGTYTPFAILRLETMWSLALTGTIWLLAGLGIAAKLVQPGWIERLSTVLYLGLGWLGVVVTVPLMHALDRPTFTLLLAGGLVYSLGVVFHHWRSLAYHTAIWHGFVLFAAGLHYVAVLRMV